MSGHKYLEEIVDLKKLPMITIEILEETKNGKNKEKSIVLTKEKFGI